MSEGSLKEIAELLRKGATMLSEACPVCGTPLFKLKNGGLICPMCNRPVKIVSKDTDIEAMARRESLENTLNVKIIQVQKSIDEETDPDELQKNIETLMKLLDALEKVKKLSS